MKLYLVQHGDSLPEEVNPERPLSERGRRDVARLADFLGQRSIRVRQIYHSGKTRACETAELLAAQVAPGTAVAAMSGINPNDPVEPIAERIKGWHDDTLLAGHMPFMGRLAALLLAGKSESMVAAFQPGTVVCLERTVTGVWAVNWMLRPELLQ